MTTSISPGGYRVLQRSVGISPGCGLHLPEPCNLVTAAIGVLTSTIIAIMTSLLIVGFFHKFTEAR